MWYLWQVGWKKETLKKDKTFKVKWNKLSIDILNSWFDWRTYIYDDCYFVSNNVFQRVASGGLVYRPKREWKQNKTKCLFQFFKYRKPENKHIRLHYFIFFFRGLWSSAALDFLYRSVLSSWKPIAFIRFIPALWKHGL